MSCITLTGTALPFYAISLKLDRGGVWPISTRYPSGDGWIILRSGAILTFLAGPLEAQITLDVKMGLIFSSLVYGNSHIKIIVRGKMASVTLRENSKFDMSLGKILSLNCLDLITVALHADLPLCNHGEWTQNFYLEHSVLLKT